MAGKLGSPCREPRCSEILTNGAKYCEKHSDAKWSTANTRESLPFYQSARWQALRKLKLGMNPICEVCNRRFANQVHHIKKAREFPHLRFVMTNLQSICVWCHARETQKETQETRNAQRNKPDSI